MALPKFIRIEHAGIQVQGEIGLISRRTIKRATAKSRRRESYLVIEQAQNEFAQELQLEWDEDAAFNQEYIDALEDEYLHDLCARDLASWVA